MRILLMDSQTRRLNIMKAPLLARKKKEFKRKDRYFHLKLPTKPMKLSLFKFPQKLLQFKIAPINSHKLKTFIFTQLSKFKKK